MLNRWNSLKPGFYEGIKPGADYLVSLASVNVVEIGLGVIAALLIPFFYSGSVLVYGTQELADDLSRRPGRMAP